MLKAWYLKDLEEEQLQSDEIETTKHDKRRIVEEDKIEGAVGNDWEGKNSSDRRNWYCPFPILRVEFGTQTDSLSLVQEYKDVDVQTDPTQLTNEETLEKGMADFERDRAARQLRKSRLSQDVIAFKNRPRESAPGSSQDSSVTETLGFFSKGSPRDSITSGYLPQQSLSQSSIVSEASSHGTEDVSSEETQRASFSSSSLPEPWTSKCSVVSEASSHGTEGVPSEDSISTGFTSKHVAKTTEAEMSGNEQSLGDPSCFSNIKGTYPVAPEKEIPYSTVPHSAGLNVAREAVNAPLQKKEFVGMLQREKGIPIALTSGDKVAEMNEKPKEANSRMNAVTSYEEMYNKESSTNVESRNVVSDGADSDYVIGSSTAVSAVSLPALGNFVFSYAKEHKHDEFLTECTMSKDKLPNSEMSRERSVQLMWNEQLNATGTTNNEDAVSLDKKMSFFGNGDYMSLPSKILHEASNTENWSERDQAFLSVIKETDDSEENDDIWNSQDVRPTRIGLHNDCIVSGVDNSFLARHSNDSSLTRSVYSRTRVNIKHKPFSSLPVCSNEREEVPFVARTWPVCDDRLLPDQNTPSSFNDKSRLPYQGLPRETGNEPVRSFDTGRFSCGEQTKNEYSGARGGASTSP